MSSRVNDPGGYRDGGIVAVMSGPTMMGRLWLLALLVSSPPNVNALVAFLCHPVCASSSTAVVLGPMSTTLPADDPLLFI
ncbi:hypothetical protein Q1695_000227 [Nippostrongylus brasiliensis]|nr:hypothetical protein Q1695_000227 [Nippostrongylus brasiliensis]